MKMLLLLALLLTLDACQNRSRLQAVQSQPPATFLPIKERLLSASFAVGRWRLRSEQLVKLGGGPCKGKGRRKRQLGIGNGR